jgi:hypothetical protein
MPHPGMDSSPDVCFIIAGYHKAVGIAHGGNGKKVSDGVSWAFEKSYLGGTYDPNHAYLSLP